MHLLPASASAGRESSDFDSICPDFEQAASNRASISPGAPKFARRSSGQLAVPRLGATRVRFEFARRAHTKKIHSEVRDNPALTQSQGRNAIFRHFSQKSLRMRELLLFPVISLGRFRRPITGGSFLAFPKEHMGRLPPGSLALLQIQHQIILQHIVSRRITEFPRRPINGQRWPF